MNLRLIFDIIVKPSSGIEELSQNFSIYYKTTIAIFVIAGLIVIFPNLVEINKWGDSSEQNPVAMKSISLVMRVSTAILQNFVIIYAVYWIGKRLGGDANYKRVFTVLSFCLVPAIIGTIGMGVATSFTANYLDMQQTDNPLGLDVELSPSYTLDFFSYAIISNVFAIVFGVWTLLLFAKAVRIMNSFDLRNVIITIGAAIVILFFTITAFNVAISTLVLVYLESKYLIFIF